MIRVPAFLLPLLVLLAFHPLPAAAQYMYLDADGDGLYTAADKMADNGTETTVRVYLFTNRDRLGTTRTCNDGFTAEGIRAVSYSVNLTASGGTVAYGAPTSASPFTSGITNVDPADGVGLLVSYGDASGTGLPEGGPHLLFTVSATGTSGSPRIDIAVGSPVNGSDRTYFATPCFGDHTSDTIWYLTTDVNLGDGEWTDADGLPPAIPVVNEPPVMAAIGNMTVDEGQTAEQAVTATDSDGTPLTFSKASGPAYMTVATLDPGSGTGSGTVRLTPGFADAGDATGTVRVSDGLASDTGSLAITVNAVLRPLDLFDIPDFVLREGFVEEGTLVASNPDGGYVHFEKTEGPWFLEVHDYAPLTARLSISVPYDQREVGVHPATVTASDGIQSDSESFTITVTDYQFALDGWWYMPRVPRAGIGSSFYVYFYDGDGPVFTSLTFDPGNIPAGDFRNFTTYLDAGYGYAIAALYWIPSSLGHYSFSATGTEAEGPSLTIPFEVDVTSFERAPVSNPGGPYSGVVGIPIEFDGRGSSDPDGDALTYRWFFGDGGSAVGSVAHHAYNRGGVFSVYLHVYDGYVTSYASTTASVVDALDARAFQEPGRDPIRLSSQKPTHCFGLEPVQASYRNEEVDLPTLRLLWAGYPGGVAPISGKTVSIEDFDRNGIPEISVCFSKEALRTLFASLTPGTHDVSARLEGRLVSGARIRASFTVTVVSAPVLAASVSPNPMNPDAVLTFRTSAAGRVSVSLYDVRGRRVRTLYEGEMPAGFHDLRIDGRSDQGTRLPSGVYFYSIESSEGTRRGRFSVVR